MAVSQALATFLPQLSGQNVVLLSANATVVASLQHQTRTVFRVLCRITAEVSLWAERHSVSLMVWYIPGKNYGFAARLSPDQILPTEWSLFSEGVRDDLLDVRSFPSHPLCRPYQCQASSVCASGSISVGVEA